MFPVSFSEIWSHYPIVECLLLLHLYWWAQFSGSHSNPKLSFQIQRSDPDALHQCYVLRAAGRGQCAVTSERSWVRGDRDTSCCLCKSGARSRSRVFPLPRILSKLPPEPPGPPPLTLRTLGPSPLPQRASGEALPRLSRSRARGACRPRASASAGANQRRCSPAISGDVSRSEQQRVVWVLRRRPWTRSVQRAVRRRSVTQLVNARAKAASQLTR